MSADAPAGAAAGGAGMRVWDLPVRITHWAIAALIPFSYWAAENHHLDWHRLSGYSLLGLLLFRLIWGFVGSDTARFAGFVRGPGAVRTYVREGAHWAKPGHNPLGGWSVLAMLAALALQIGLGLFAIDEDGLDGGPLSHLISFDQARSVAEVHEITFYVVVGLAGLHIATILYYWLVRRDNLVRAMWTGKAPLPGEAPNMAPIGRAMVAALIAGALAWFVANGLKF